MRLAPSRACDPMPLPEFSHLRDQVSNDVSVNDVVSHMSAHPATALLGHAMRALEQDLAHEAEVLSVEGARRASKARTDEVQRLDGLDVRRLRLAFVLTRLEALVKQAEAERDDDAAWRAFFRKGFGLVDEIEQGGPAFQAGRQVSRLLVSLFLRFMDSAIAGSRSFELVRPKLLDRLSKCAKNLRGAPAASGEAPDAPGAREADLELNRRFRLARAIYYYARGECEHAKKILGVLAEKDDVLLPLVRHWQAELVGGRVSPPAPLEEKPAVEASPKHCPGCERPPAEMRVAHPRQCPICRRRRLAFVLTRLNDLVKQAEAVRDDDAAWRAFFREGFELVDEIERGGRAFQAGRLASRLRVSLFLHFMDSAIAGRRSFDLVGPSLLDRLTKCAKELRGTPADVGEAPEAHGAREADLELNRRFRLARAIYDHHRGRCEEAKTILKTLAKELVALAREQDVLLGQVRSWQAELVRDWVPRSAPAERLPVVKASPKHCRGCGRTAAEMGVAHPRQCPRCGPLKRHERTHCEFCGFPIPTWSASVVDCDKCSRTATYP